MKAWHLLTGIIAMYARRPNAQLDSALIQRKLTDNPLIAIPTVGPSNLYYYEQGFKLRVPSMTDIRSMLRSELALRGSAAQTGSTGRVTKKRKIEGPDTIRPAHKKLRPTTPAYNDVSEMDDNQQIESANTNQGIPEEDEEDIAQSEEAGPHLPEDELSQQRAVSPNQQNNTIKSSMAEVSASNQSIDENEWAAFEREVVAPTRTIPAAAVSSVATISAAPVTAEELAAQQQKQKEEQAKAHEEDIEGEKEDAARHLEEEFEEMEQLEERVKRLKAKREELRARNMVDSNDTTIDDHENTLQDGEGSEDDDEGDDDWDDWRFR
ncbi:conserved hypothetical protein [Talaromyces stipitatus ATCC 10500]|uniref:Uncharacterized protein n=1 Tax=Talaromyces stipitatus (strain ATCC 10500 / CBS 375.48 / QM 6759 / NRRL 1006) TaxID=441959 RepID=B8LYQ5_TALSN|nr:uncharacterized protein TSTA_068390 [Talaromyces stipitatus ATCC 10500]EED23413.1 conserved hypothetical protein [Talaromyces stipitatus ATCC 10500]